MNMFRIAATAVREAGRRRIVWIALLAGAAFLSMYGLGLHFALGETSRAKTDRSTRYVAAIWPVRRP